MTFEEILEHITALLTFNVIKVSDQQITLGDILFIPLLIIGCSETSSSSDAAAPDKPTIQKIKPNQASMVLFSFKGLSL